MSNTEKLEDVVLNFDSDYEDDSGDIINVDDSYSKVQKQPSIVGADGNVIDIRDVSPMDVIRKLSKEQNIPIQEPKSSCKHCWGRGWIGRLQNGAPVACDCIYPQQIRQIFKLQEKQFVFENRQVKRNKKFQKSKAEAEIKMFNAQLKRELELEKQFQIKAKLRPDDSIKTSE